MEKTITRPALRYHGGKFKLAPRILSHFPSHRVYTESFGGGASVLLRKARSYAEVYNDIDGDVVNLFRVLREQGKRLKESIYHTPFSRDEFVLSYEPTQDNFERARRTSVRAYQGFGSAGATMQKTGFRSNSNRSGTTPAHDWANFPSAMDAITERLRGVVIENRDAVAVMVQHDSPDTLHYVDPPYVLDTRSKGQSTSCYRYEMSNEQHEALCEKLLSLTGKVVLSGYVHSIYDTMLSAWQRIDINAYADGAKPRVESLWLNKAAQAQHLRTLNLFTLSPETT